MQFLERDLEDIIYNTPNDVLQRKNLFIVGKKRRQVRIGNYGIADLITIDRPGYYPKENNYGGFFPDPLTITVYELKQDQINTKSLLQALRYARGIKRYLDYRKFHFYAIKICLIGRNIEQGPFLYFPDFSEDISFLTYGYDVNGIEFKEHKNYSLIDESF